MSRKNYKKLPGSPDIAITKVRIAIFIDGEFWHGYDWNERKHKLNNNREYWIEKIEENIARDQRNDQLLEGLGWIPIHFWETKVLKDIDACMGKITDIVSRRGDVKKKATDTAITEGDSSIGSGAGDLET